MTPAAYPVGGGGGWWAQRVASWERGGLAVVVMLLALLVGDLALGLAYAAATPIWQNPDEPAHYNYIAYVAQSGGLPELRAGDWDSGLLEQVKNGQIAPTDPRIGTIRYEAWQPPLYYLLAGQVFKLGPQTDTLAEVRLLRGLDVVLGGLTSLLGYLIGREVFGSSQWLALAVPLTMAGVPMFSSVASAVSADPLANLLAAMLTLLLLRGARAERSAGHTDAPVAGPAKARATPAAKRTAGWALATGVALGLGLLTKLALAVFVPLALLMALRQGRRQAAIVLVVPLLLLAPWLVHQVTTYGWLDPFATARHAQVVADQARFPGFSPEYLQAFATTSFHSFWAQFGWMAIPAPERLYWAWGGLTLLGVLGLLRTRLDARWWLLLAIVLLSLVAYVGYNLAYLQFQGRYLFIALAPICALLVRGWSACVPSRAGQAVPLLIGALLLGLNVYALTRVLEPGFRG